MTYYANGNKAGKILDYRLRGCRYKARIPYIVHPITNDKHYHPKNIGLDSARIYAGVSIDTPRKFKAALAYLLSVFRIRRN